MWNIDTRSSALPVLSSMIGCSMSTGDSVPNRDVNETSPSAVDSVTSIAPSPSRSPNAAGPDCAGVTIESTPASAPVGSPWRTTSDVFDTPTTSPAPS
jgi:hypothetical protein